MVYKKIFHSMKNIKNWEEFSRVNELKAETYSKIASNTTGYPWRMTYKDQDGNYKTNPRAEKEKRVNDLSMKRFESEFMKEFGGRTINNGGKEYELVGIKFKANWINYGLIFEEVGGTSSLPRMLYISYDHPIGKYYIEGAAEDELDGGSKALIMDMFKYMRK